MMRKLLELNESLRGVTDLETHWALCHAALEQYGVKGVFYGAFATQRETTTRKLSRTMIWKTTYPDEFLDAFGDASPVDDDYTVEHCVTRSDVLLWHEDDSWNSKSAKQRAKDSVYHDLGFRVGVSVPASNCSPGQVGGMGLWMPDVGLREFTRYWKHAEADVIALCGVLDSGMRQNHMDKLIGLSLREKECLTWLASGLRADQIADRLHIGSKAVEKYVAGAKRKLKAATRDHAVARAIIFGVIQP